MITPLQYDQFNRETWGDFDAAVMAQLSAIAYDSCYKPKLYKAPDSTSEVVANNAYVSFGLPVTPGSLLFGFYQANQSGYLVQVTSIDLDYKLFSQPVPVQFLANDFKSAGFPNLMPAQLPAVGTGVHTVELWNNSGGTLRIQFAIGALEVIQ